MDMKFANATESIGGNGLTPVTQPAATTHARKRVVAACLAVAERRSGSRPIHATKVLIGAAAGRANRHHVGTIIREVRGECEFVRGGQCGH
jgi:hypothetical protein